MLKEEWGAKFPPYDTLPTEAFELTVSYWCRKLAEDFAEPLPAPGSVQPWILVRLATAVIHCKIEQAGSKKPPSLSPEVLRDLLVKKWEGEFRSKWDMMVLALIDDEDS